jgi:hypothetical protein
LLLWSWGPPACWEAGCGMMSELKIRIETDEWIFEEFVEA